MKFLKWLRKRPPVALAAKDPSDGKKSESSTNWVPDYRHCKACNASLSHEQARGRFCPHCGTYERFLLINGRRVVRQIYDGAKWVWQYKYPDGRSEVVDSPYVGYRNIGE